MDERDWPPRDDSSWWRAAVCFGEADGTVPRTFESQKTSRRRRPVFQKRGFLILSRFVHQKIEPAELGISIQLPLPAFLLDAVNAACYLSELVGRQFLNSTLEFLYAAHDLILHAPARKPKRSATLRCADADFGCYPRPICLLQVSRKGSRQTRRQANDRACLGAGEHVAVPERRSGGDR
jgi:hypothetical protein